MKIVAIMVHTVYTAVEFIEEQASTFGKSWSLNLQVAVQSIHFTAEGPRSGPKSLRLLVFAGGYPIAFLGVFENCR